MISGKFSKLTDNSINDSNAFLTVSVFGQFYPGDTLREVNIIIWFWILF